MPVRIEQKGPVAVYLFRRTRDDRVTVEIPAISVPAPSAPAQVPSAPPEPASAGP